MELATAASFRLGILRTTLVFADIIRMLSAVVTRLIVLALVTLSIILPMTFGSVLLSTLGIMTEKKA
jgi:hypothetical protein